MIIKVKFIQAIWDNYQGGSGRPIIAEKYIEVPDETMLLNLETIILSELRRYGFKSDFTQDDYKKEGIQSMEIINIL